MLSPGNYWCVVNWELSFLNDHILFHIDLIVMVMITALNHPGNPKPNLKLHLIDLLPSAYFFHPLTFSTMPLFMSNSEKRVVEGRGDESLFNQFHCSFKGQLEIKLKSMIKGSLVPAESSVFLSHTWTFVNNLWVIKDNNYLINFWCILRYFYIHIHHLKRIR